MELIDWYKTKHPNFHGDNQPNPDSQGYLKQLKSQIITPVAQKFGQIEITYGFTNPELLRYVQKNSPGDMAPEIDQHAAMEINLHHNRICKRDGAACDIFIQDYANKMHEIAKYIVNNLTFDRLYFYGKNSPIHISIGPEQARYALLRLPNGNGLRVNRKSGKGIEASTLFDHL